MIRVRRAPAKINLGLEIIGRRADSYHELRSILCTISLEDTLTYEPATADEVAIRGTIDVPNEANLVLRTLREMRARGATLPPQHVTIEKLIPAAAGLGGASSDAAATLDAFAPELEIAGLDPFAIAASLGSDVPFFLGAPVALASGRGELLAPLPGPIDAWVVLVTPDIEIADKTRTMYAAIDPAWWSDGSLVDAIARQLPAPPAKAPFNVFERALSRAFPESDFSRDALLAAGAPFAALTGAGPTYYTIVDTETEAQAIAGRLAQASLNTCVARFGVVDA